MVNNLVNIAICLCAISRSTSFMFEKCKLNSDECLKSGVQNAISRFSKGDKKLNILELDPLQVPAVEIIPDLGHVNLYQKYTNCTFRGISNAKVGKVVVNLNPCNIYLETAIPEVKSASNYILKGKFLFFDIDSEGDASCDVFNVRLKINMTCDKYKSNEQEYLNITNVKSQILFGKINSHIGEFIKGNDEINHQLEKLINEDPLNFFGPVMPSLENVLSYVTKTQSNNIFHAFPVSEIFDTS